MCDAVSKYCRGCDEVSQWAPDEETCDICGEELQGADSHQGGIAKLIQATARIAELKSRNARLVDDHIEDTKQVGTLAAFLLEDLGEKPTGENVCVAAARLLSRERERATEWEGIAAGRLARAERAEDALKLERVRSAKRQTEIERLDGEMGGLYAGVETASARIALLEKTLRFIEHVDKTPPYGYTRLQADKDRRGMLPEKSGQRWKSPREIVRELKLTSVAEAE